MDCDATQAIDLGEFGEEEDTDEETGKNEKRLVSSHYHQFVQLLCVNFEKEHNVKRCISSLNIIKQGLNAIR